MKTFLMTGTSRGLGSAYVACLFKQAKAEASGPITVIGLSRSPAKASEWYMGHEMDWRQAESAASPRTECYDYQNDDQYKMIHVQGCVTDESSIHQIQQLIAKKCQGQLAGLICNAATARPIGRVEDLDVKGLMDLFEVNVFSIIRLVQAMIPALRQARQATIICIGSGIVQHPSIGTTSYTCSKVALDMFCRILSMEEEQYGIRTLSIYPGVVKTRMLNDMLEQGIEEELAALNLQQAYRSLLI